MKLIPIKFIIVFFVLAFQISLANASNVNERKLRCSTYVGTIGSIIKTNVLPTVAADVKASWEGAATTLDEISLALISNISHFDEVQTKELINKATNEAVADYEKDPANFFDQNRKIFKTINACIELYKKYADEAINIEPKPKPNLNYLFVDGKLWVSDASVNQSNLRCGDLLANSKNMMIFTKLEPKSMTLYLRIGGKHPFKEELGRSTDKDINVPVKIENIESYKNILTFDRYEYPSNGAVLGGTYQLDVNAQTLVQVRSHTCQRCDEAQMRVHTINKQGSSSVSYQCIN